MHLFIPIILFKLSWSKNSGNIQRVEYIGDLSACFSIKLSINLYTIDVPFNVLYIVSFQGPEKHKQHPYISFNKTLYFFLEITWTRDIIMRRTTRSQKKPLVDGSSIGRCILLLIYCTVHYCTQFN